MLRIKLVRSPIGNTARNRATVKALGLRKMHQTVEHNDSPSIRGMIHSVKHLLQVEVNDQPLVKAPAQPKKARPPPRQRQLRSPRQPPRLRSHLRPPRKRKLLSLERRQKQPAPRRRSKR